MLNKSNYILLGMAISYILIAIIQIRLDGLLPATLYVTVAFVSLEFTTFEMLKNTTDFLICRLDMINTIAKSRTEFIEKSIKTYDKFNVLGNETELLKNELAILPNRDTLSQNNRKIKVLQKSVMAISCIQIVICTIQIMITPLKLIPYDKLTNELINVMTLLSFAFMFLSYFLSSINENQKNYQGERWHIYETTCSEYLEILEKVASDNENKKEI
ncbi:MAG TPA: hypothetical protein DEB74_03510 [Lachnospiraceae bacterium]|nr:hypothetical protein [Lachnospiraceae bacterium]